MVTDQKREIGRQRERVGKLGTTQRRTSMERERILVNLSHQCVPNEEITGANVSKSQSSTTARLTDG